MIDFTNKSAKSVSKTLKSNYAIPISPPTVGGLIGELGYRKSTERKSDFSKERIPNLKRTFRHINTVTSKFFNKGNPVIFVDSRKKNLFGKVLNIMEHYPSDMLLSKYKYIPWKIRNLKPDSSYVPRVFKNFISYVKTSFDDKFPDPYIEALDKWWNLIGKSNFPNASALLILLDSRPKNKISEQLWQFHLAQFSAFYGIKVHVLCFPPGRYFSKITCKIEHNLFYVSFPSQNRRSGLYISLTIQLLSKPLKGKIKLSRDFSNIEKIWWIWKISEKQLLNINIKNSHWFGNWSYSISGFKHLTNFKDKKCPSMTTIQQELVHGDYDIIWLLKQVALSIGIHHDLTEIFEQEPKLSLLILEKSILAMKFARDYSFKEILKKYFYSNLAKLYI